VEKGNIGGDIFLDGFLSFGYWQRVASTTHHPFYRFTKYFENFPKIYQKIAFPLANPAQLPNLIRLPMFKLYSWGKS